MSAVTHCPHCHCKLGEPHVPLSALLSQEVVEAADKAIDALYDRPEEASTTLESARAALQAAHKALQEADHD